MSKKPYTTKLSNIAFVLQGQSPESKYYSNFKGVPFLQGNRTFGFLYPFFDTYTKKITKITNKGDVLMSVRAPVGDLNLAPNDLCIGRGLSSIKAKNGNNKFIYYALKFNIKNLMRQGGATTFDSVNKDTINNFELAIPENEKDREKVAELLSVLDSKIELNNKINSELEKMAKTLYDYWFVQFDFPDDNGKPYKSSGGKMVYNETLKREIPDGWKFDNLKNRLETFLGGTPKTSKKEYWDNGDIHWLSSGEVSEFPILSSKDFITEEGLNSSATKLIKEKSLMISITGNIRVSILGINSAANQSVVSISNDELLDNSYTYFYIKNNIPYYESLMTGAVQKHINKDVVDNTQLLIPESLILKKYIKLAKPMINQILEKSKENQKLIELRDWLLPMLMNGQVTVKDSS